MSPVLISIKDICTTTKDIEQHECPFYNVREHLQDPMENSCYLPGGFVLAELATFGYTNEAALMCVDMTAVQARRFGKRLREIVGELNKRWPEENKQPHGAWQWAKNDAKPTDSNPTEPSEFDYALASIEGAADWYGVVGEHGSGVQANVDRVS